MKKSLLFALGVLSLLAILLGLAGGAQAQNPHYAIADNYTDSNNPNTNFGTNGILQLSADNTGTSCTAATYLWFKFAIPATSSTIGNATLNVVFNDLFGSGALATELRSSADTSWIESGEGSLTWNNQPALETTVLGTSPSVDAGGTATYGGANSALATYLNNHKGQNVSLVVRGDCNGAIGFGALRLVFGLESLNNGVSMDLFSPTAVGLLSFSGASSGFSPWNMLVIAGLLLLALTLYLVLRRQRAVR